MVRCHPAHGACGRLRWGVNRAVWPILENGEWLFETFPARPESTVGAPGNVRRLCASFRREPSVAGSSLGTVPAGRWCRFVSRPPRPPVRRAPGSCCRGGQPFGVFHFFATFALGVRDNFDHRAFMAAAIRARAAELNLRWTFCFREAFRLGIRAGAGAGDGEACNSTVGTDDADAGANSMPKTSDTSESLMAGAVPALPVVCRTASAMSDSEVSD